MESNPAFYPTQPATQSYPWYAAQRPMLCFTLKKVIISGTLDLISNGKLVVLQLLLNYDSKQVQSKQLALRDDRNCSSNPWEGPPSFPSEYNREKEELCLQFSNGLFFLSERRGNNENDRQNTSSVSTEQFSIYRHSFNNRLKLQWTKKYCFTTCICTYNCHTIPIVM